MNYGRQLVARFVGDAAPARVVIDVGAGAGADLDAARACLPGAAFHAIESHAPSVDALRARGYAVHPLDIERDRLPFESGSVDIVIANQVLEHTKELFWIAHEVSRVLRVGGSFVVGVPNLASLHNRVLLAFGRQPTQIRSASAHVRGFTRPDLLAFFDDCFPGGYRCAGFGGSNFYPFPPVLARPLARAFPTMAWGIFARMVKQSPYERQFLDYPAVHRLETRFHLGD
ncbi:MAG: methyltransferase domain-containing protein [Burkholderiales bacterium]|nr:methyltransferase domain-containing protein [Burkholderiales bacterium]